MTTQDKTPIRALIEAVEAGQWDGSWRVVIDAGINTHALFSTAYHGSLDAAKELHEALLPGWVYNIAPSFAHVLPAHDNGDQEAHTGVSNNPALAWLIAILRAYEAQQ